MILEDYLPQIPTRSLYNYAELAQLVDGNAVKHIIYTTKCALETGSTRMETPG